MLLLAFASSKKLSCQDSPAGEKGLKTVLETLSDGILDPEPKTACGCEVCPCDQSSQELTREEVERATYKGAKNAVKKEVDRF